MWGSGLYHKVCVAAFEMSAFSYICQIDDGKTTSAKELRDESHRNDVDGRILTVFTDRLLPISGIITMSSSIRVLTPVYKQTKESVSIGDAPLFFQTQIGTLQVQRTLSNLHTAKLSLQVF